MDSKIQVAREQHLKYVDEICQLMQQAAEERGTGIAKRSPEYIKSKILHGQAVISTAGNRFSGFCYIETWGHEKYVANSGLIVHPDFRKTGLAKRIKKQIFSLSREKYPDSKIFGITTSLAVMKINSDLGYKPVTFSELTPDEEFWQGCQSCRNFDILTRTNRSHCLCTGMLYEQKKEVKVKINRSDRWEGFKRFLKLHRILAYRRRQVKLNPKKAVL